MNLQTSKNSQNQTTTQKTFDFTKTTGDVALLAMNTFKTLIALAMSAMIDKSFKEIQYNLIEKLNACEDMGSLIESMKGFIDVQEIIQLQENDFEKFLVKSEEKPEEKVEEVTQKDEVEEIIPSKRFDHNARFNHVE